VFLEALANKCAVLSSVNPDGIVSKFGYWVKDNDFKNGLRTLLSNNSWRMKGEAGYKYVQKVHDLNKVVMSLIDVISR